MNDTPVGGRKKQNKCIDTERMAQGCDLVACLESLPAHKPSSGGQIISYTHLTAIETYITNKMAAMNLVLGQNELRDFAHFNSRTSFFPHRLCNSNI